MSAERTGLRVVVWLVVPVVAFAVCAFGGAALGTITGDALGSPEGEGFIGFLYGLYGGGAVGVLVGVFAAWRLDVALRAPAH